MATVSSSATLFYLCRVPPSRTTPSSSILWDPIEEAMMMQQLHQRQQAVNSGNSSSSSFRSTSTTVTVPSSITPPSARLPPVDPATIEDEEGSSPSSMSSSALPPLLTVFLLDSDLRDGNETTGDGNRQPNFQRKSLTFLGAQLRAYAVWSAGGSSSGSGPEGIQPAALGASSFCVPPRTVRGSSGSGAAQSSRGACDNDDVVSNLSAAVYLDSRRSSSDDHRNASTAPPSSAADATAATVRFYPDRLQDGLARVMNSNGPTTTTMASGEPSSINSLATGGPGVGSRPPTIEVELWLRTDGCTEFSTPTLSLLPGAAAARETTGNAVSLAPPSAVLYDGGWLVIRYRFRTSVRPLPLLSPAAVIAARTAFTVSAFASQDAMRSFAVLKMVDRCRENAGNEPPPLPSFPETLAPGFEYGAVDAAVSAQRFRGASLGNLIVLGGCAVLACVTIAIVAQAGRGRTNQPFASSFSSAAARLTLPSRLLIVWGFVIEGGVANAMLSVSFTGFKIWYDIVLMLAVVGLAVAVLWAFAAVVAKTPLIYLSRDEVVDADAMIHEGQNVKEAAAGSGGLTVVAKLKRLFTWGVVGLGEWRLPPQSTVSEGGARDYDRKYGGVYNRLRWSADSNSVTTMYSSRDHHHTAQRGGASASSGPPLRVVGCVASGDATKVADAAGAERSSSPSLSVKRGIGRRYTLIDTAATVAIALLRGIDVPNWGRAAAPSATSNAAKGVFGAPGGSPQVSALDGVDDQQADTLAARRRVLCRTTAALALLVLSGIAAVAVMTRPMMAPLRNATLITASTLNALAMLVLLAAELLTSPETGSATSGASSWIFQLRVAAALMVTASGFVGTINTAMTVGRLLLRLGTLRWGCLQRGRHHIDGRGGDGVETMESQDRTAAFRHFAVDPDHDFDRDSIAARGSIASDHKVAELDTLLHDPVEGGGGDPSSTPAIARSRDGLLLDDDDDDNPSGAMANSQHQEEESGRSSGVSARARLGTEARLRVLDDSDDDTDAGIAAAMHRLNRERHLQQLLGIADDEHTPSHEATTAAAKASQRIDML